MAALTVTVTPGYVLLPGVKPSVDDWNRAFRPNIVIEGEIDGSLIADQSITFDHLHPNVILGGTETTTVRSLDKFLVGVASLGDNRVATFQTILKSMQTESAEVTAFADWAGDWIVFWESDDLLPVKMRVARFFEQAMSQPAAITDTENDDSVLVHDNTGTDGAQVVRVSLRNILPKIHAAELTVNNPTQIVVGRDGRVTSISDTEGSVKYTSAETALPTAAGYANAVSFDTKLKPRPRFIQGWLKCTHTGGDAGWVQNDVIPLSWVKFDTTTSTYFNGEYGFLPLTDGIVLLFAPDNGGIAPKIPRKDTGDDNAFAIDRWKVIVEASL